MATQLTKNFTLEELIHSDTAIAQGIDNTPTPEIKDRLQLLAEVLEKIRSRALLNLPITVNDAYRCPALNAAVGGVPNSAHEQGFAADITCEKYGNPYQVANAIKACMALPVDDPHAIRLDQLIFEGGAQQEGGVWVHVSRDPQGRGEFLTLDPAQTTGYGSGIYQPAIA